MLFSPYLVRAGIILKQSCFKDIIVLVLSCLVAQRLGTTATSVYQSRLLRYQSIHASVDADGVTYLFLTFLLVIFFSLRSSHANGRPPEKDY